MKLTPEQAEDRELLVLAAKAAGVKYTDALPNWDSDWDVLAGALWNPLGDDGDALRLAVQLRINIIFSGGRHHVGRDRWVIDICGVGGLDSIRRGIIRAAAEIGRSMP
jgi:hypothetical protein